MNMASPAETHPGHGEEEKEESFGYAMQLALGTVLPMAMQVAIELGIFDIIDKAGPNAKLSASDIATKMPTKNPDAPMMLDRILRLLASHHVLGCSVDGLQRLYNLAPVSKYFVRNQDGVSLGPLMALIQDKVFLQSWCQLKDSILEGGIPFNRVHGTHAFEYPGLDPRFNQVFNTAMFNHTTIVIESILESYKGFEHLKQLVDIGGGLGYTLKAITSRYPHIKGVENVGGDMFESVPKGDGIFMKWILHDWSDDHCLKLLKNCHSAIPNDGKVIVVEAVLPIMAQTSAAAKAISQQDVLMMTQNPGGKERTEHEFRTLATAAGFRGNFQGKFYKPFFCKNKLYTEHYGFTGILNLNTKFSPVMKSTGPLSITFWE